MAKTVVDGVKQVRASKRHRRYASRPDYLEAMKVLGSLQEMGIVSRGGNNLLPIEERHKSAYNTRGF